MIRWILSFSVMMAVVCCTTPNNKVRTIDAFYDINGLIDQQVHMLDSIGPSFLKTATINGQQEFHEITPNDSTWKTELNIFRTLDLNKPTLIDSYLMQVDSVGGHKITTWISKYTDETMVDTLRIYFGGAPSPDLILAHLSSQNTLFKTTKKMELVFKENNGLLMLQHFRIDGRQKMISKDSTTYQIKAEVKY